MPADPRLLALPALRAEAEKLTRELWVRPHAPRPPVSAFGFPFVVQCFDTRRLDAAFQAAAEVALARVRDWPAVEAPDPEDTDVWPRVRRDTEMVEQWREILAVVDDSALVALEATYGGPDAR